jgi:branched-chain amino acid transport system ATP-binding protein
MALLEVHEVTVQFGGLRALSEASLDVEAGAVTGLIGPNGAGKTTLFNVVCGIQGHRRGRVLLDGHDLGSAKPHRRGRFGIARTFQRLEVFGSLTVRDNILVAAEVHRRRIGGSPAVVADEVLERVGLTAVAGERVDTIPTGLARLVELGRAVACRPRVLLLDEPSSGLDEGETAALAALLAGLAEEGLGILLVEHDVALVMRACSRIYVLDFGEILMSGTPGEVRAHPEVRAAYLGNMPTGEVA